MNFIMPMMICRLRLLCMNEKVRPAGRMGGARDEQVENSLCGGYSETGHASPWEAHLPEGGAHKTAPETRLMCNQKTQRPDCQSNDGQKRTGIISTHERRGRAKDGQCGKLRRPDRIRTRRVFHNGCPVATSSLTQ